jgi:antitoxin ChpS
MFGSVLCWIHCFYKMLNVVFLQCIYVTAVHMELSISKWGNSAAVRLSTEFLSLLNVKLGDKLAVDIRPEGALLRPKRYAYSLADLVKQCNVNAPEPEDMAGWNKLKAHDREKW